MNKKVFVKPAVNIMQVSTQAPLLQTVSLDHSDNSLQSSDFNAPASNVKVNTNKSIKR